MKTYWLMHPKNCGVLILVARGFWGQIFKPKLFATQAEVVLYHAYKWALRHG